MPFTPETAHTGTQFKPGQSGNPSGPKPGYKHINTWIQELLNDEKFEIKIQEGYKVVDYKGAPLNAILRAQLMLALNSKDEGIRIKATELLLKHGWPARSQADVTSDGERIGIQANDEQLAQLIAARTGRADIQGRSD